MAEVGVHRFVIESTQFAKLERALSVALPAARSLGVDAGIFWLRDSIFAATPYASIGLANFDLELEDAPECIAISQPVARLILYELRSHRVRYLEKIGLVVAYDQVVFTFEYDRNPGVETQSFISRYLGSWRPRLKLREHYELLTAHRICFECELSIKEMRARLQGYRSKINDDAYYGYVAFKYFSNVVWHASISRSLLLAFFEAAKDEDTTFRLAYYGDQRCVVCRAGDVIAILSVID